MNGDPKLRVVGGLALALLIVGVLLVVFVIIALTVNIVAFQREFQVVRENRRTIGEINELLESREGSESPS